MGYFYQIACLKPYGGATLCLVLEILWNIGFLTKLASVPSIIQIKLTTGLLAANPTCGIKVLVIAVLCTVGQLYIQHILSLISSWSTSLFLACPANT